MDDKLHIAKEFVEFGLGAVIAVVMTLLVIWLIKQFNDERKDWYDRQQKRDDNFLAAMKAIEDAMRNICKRDN